MKNITLLAVAMVFAVSAGAQNSWPIANTQHTPVYSEDKSVSMYHNIGNDHFSVISSEWEVATPATVRFSSLTAATTNDCYKMIGTTMFVVRGETQTGMCNYATVKNGAVVLITGVVITNGGKVLHLNSGDSVDMKGIVTRNMVDESKLVAEKLQNQRYVVSR